MSTGQMTDSGQKEEGAEKNQLSAPSIALPKGGGAIRGIGEKFAANPVTGTGSMSVPIATSPGRSGFGPQLSLAYDSGAGNGPFGLGWSLSLPSIARKTDKGLPHYRDAEESDVFILSGAEDLVPVLRSDGIRFEDNVSVAGYTIYRYRPRIEGLFARIERWTHNADGHTHWRSITKDNITTLYGRTAESQIVDPTEETRIFSWLICESYDDKGNAIRYEYKAENSEDVDLSAANERNRSRSAQRYLKRIKYGNKTPHQRGDDLSRHNDDDWMFEVVFDYGEHYTENGLTSDDRSQPTGVHREDDGQRTWALRQDPFSSYRAGFEVRTYRLCQRVLMFHHFPGDLEIDDYLVRATHFNISPHPTASFITAVTQSGYLWQAESKTYLKKSLPPVEFQYSEANIDETIREVEGDSLENIPYGLDGSRYQWVDLDGEGLSGILTEQGGAWFYKRNVSALPVAGSNGKPTVAARFAPLQRLPTMPSPANLSGGQQLLDLAGDGQLDLVEFDSPTPGFFERTPDEGWETFAPFMFLPNAALKDPNLRFVDLTGDGHADMLIAEDEVFTWYPSLAEAGFGPAEKVRHTLDEEVGPRLVFADGTQSVYLSDMSGDGLTDLVRIRNGEVCYWPNLGYGRFGAKVTMGNAPWFDALDQFDQKRILLADIDGSGAIDILYLGRDGVHLYFNRSGNSWSTARTLNTFPRVDNLSSVMAVDLLGNGTACLVWSSPLPGDARRPMRYIDLMGGQKPHLLIKTVNNLGAETEVQYAPSTKFYLQDKRAGKPWITKLPFPVHVVERVETHDQISGNRFVTRYAYHHGFFDGEEREFRGFGMVEQWDTEEFAALTSTGMLSEATNIDAASHVPPVLTKTWFHTGVYLDREYISHQFEREYYREPGLSDPGFQAQLLADTVLPGKLTLEEEREACRALKGAMLRQEVYALDDTEKKRHPYTVTEQNFTVERLQPRDGNRHGVFFIHAREAISYHYERNPADPRISHALTLEVDGFGNVLRSIAVGYPRANVSERQPEQNETHLTLTLNRFANRDDQPDWYRVGLPVETRTFEVVKPPRATQRFTYTELSDLVTALIPLAQDEPAATKTIPYERWDWRDQWNPQAEPGGMTNTRLRLIEHVRTRYRNNDLTDLLPLSTIASLALPGESYKLALTPGLLAQVFKRKHADLPDEELLSNSAPLLEGQDADQGGYVAIDGNWWIPTGRVFFSATATAAATELTEARQHFFAPQRYTDPFGHSTVVAYDAHDLLVIRTSDALDNTLTAANDYRVLQPWLVSDPNGNRTAAAFDALGMLVATAVMGKQGESLGDLLEDFDADPLPASLQAFIANPQIQAALLLGKATTRIVYDLDRHQRAGQPPFAATLARETHFFDPGGDQTKIQISFSYSDGFGREIQKKIQAEAGIAPQRQADVTLSTGDIRPGDLVRDAQGNLMPDSTPRRWVGSGRTVFNNKGKPVRQYEPFFSATHLYEPERDITDTGVSPILFYDPVERVVATLHPNHTWEKVVFDPWRQETWDVNDTVLLTDPKADADVSDFFRRLPNANYLPTWYTQRQGGVLGPQEQAAASKAAIHAATPTVAHADALGRTFLTIAHNKFKYSDTPRATLPTEAFHRTRVILDIEGNQREVRDERNNSLGNLEERIVMRYDYDMLGSRIHQASMEAGERWKLNDVMGKPIRAWNSRNHSFRSEYDALRRPLRSFVTGADPANPNQELLTERLVYGEQHPQDELRNLRGKLYLHLDQAGVVSSEAHDFKGNLLRATRRLAQEYKQAINWSTVNAAIPADSTTKFIPTTLEAALAPQLEADTYTSHTTYDALNRPLTMISPDGSVYHPTFNEANLLDKVDVNLRGAAAMPFVTNIDYDAKGQRERIVYGNGALTTYEYDPFTFRLIHLKTTRPTSSDATASQLFQSAAVVQDLRYTYDPVGNLTRIEDAALKTVFHNNQQVEPVCNYTYDASYRLIEAQGREHIGQNAFEFNPPNDNNRDHPFVGHQANPNDLQALHSYTQRYEYDAVGNFEALRHVANGGSWIRRYDYEEASLIEVGKQSNRLTRTTIGNGLNHTESYSYRDANGNDVNGCMTTINGMQMVWDFEDQLQQVGLGGGGTAYYVYDAGGQRVRKVIENQNDTPKEERLYLGGFEIFRTFGANALTRETLHIMDDKQRIALVETQVSPILAPAVIRYQFGNHLGSASLELDRGGELISYEEYHPYGTTAFQAGRSTAEVSLKRYRYTGKERDEESGLNYHGARYLLCSLGRWVAADPAGLIDGLNLYCFVSNNPLAFSDSQGLAKEDGIGTIATHRKHEYSLYDKLGNRISEDEHVIPKASQEAVTRNPKTDTPDFKNRHYQNNTTVRGEKSFADEKTRGGPTSDNPRSATLNNKARTGVPIDVNKELLVDSLDNAKRARSATGSILTDDHLHKTALAQMGELFEINGHNKRKKVEISWERASDASIQKEQQSLQKAAEAAKAAPDKTAAKSTAKALETVAEKGGKTILKKLGTAAIKVVPLVGIGAGFYSAKAEAAQGNYGTAALEGIGLIPVVGDVVDAARLGVAVGEVASEVLGIEAVAAEHGDRFEAAAKALGLGSDASRMVGATAAALSSISVAPSIALERTVMGWFR
jgi:RHS repeat-associated protein